MNDLNNVLSKYKIPIVFVGLILGFLNVFDVIPLDLLGDYTKIVMAIVIIIAGYVFYSQYIQDAAGGRFQQPPSRAPSRDYSNPNYQR
jgi:hypothetical protein